MHVTAQMTEYTDPRKPKCFWGLVISGKHQNLPDLRRSAQLLRMGHCLQKNRGYIWIKKIRFKKNFIYPEGNSFVISLACVLYKDNKTRIKKKDKQ